MTEQKKVDPALVMKAAVRVLHDELNDELAKQAMSEQLSLEQVVGWIKATQFVRNSADRAGEAWKGFQRYYEFVVGEPLDTAAFARAPVTSVTIPTPARTSAPLGVGAESPQFSEGQVRSLVHTLAWTFENWMTDQAIYDADDPYYKSCRTYAKRILDDLFGSKRSDEMDRRFEAELAEGRKE